MKKSTLFIITGILLSLLCTGQENKLPHNLKYYGSETMLLEGTALQDSLKERTFDRLPVKSKDKVHPHVWYISRTSAGLALSFETNASTIGIKWEVLRNEQLNHMPATGVKGLDLYVNTGKSWRYVNTAKPTGKSSEYLLVNDSSDTLREFRLYLPLYDGLETLELGLNPEAVIRKPDRNWSMKPIAFYGTSITQGGCASRPGMVYSNIMSRKLNVECINLGFSGNGRMETGVAKAMAEMDASLYVIDCIGNMTVELVHQNVRPLVKTIRQKRPHTPIVFIESLMFERTFLNDSLRNSVVEKNNALKAEYVKLAENGEDEIYYIGVHNATGEDQEGSVDGIHLTDLGFLRFSDYLISEFKRLELIRIN